MTPGGRLIHLEINACKVSEQMSCLNLVLVGWPRPISRSTAGYSVTVDPYTNFFVLQQISNIYTSVWTTGLRHNGKPVDGKSTCCHLPC